MKHRHFVLYVMFSNLCALIYDKEQLSSICWNYIFFQLLSLLAYFMFSNGFKFIKKKDEESQFTFDGWINMIKFKTMQFPCLFSLSHFLLFALFLSIFLFIISSTNEKKKHIFQFLFSHFFLLTISFFIEWKQWLIFMKWSFS